MCLLSCVWSLCGPALWGVFLGCFIEDVILWVFSRGVLLGCSLVIALSCVKIAVISCGCSMGGCSLCWCSQVVVIFVRVLFVGVLSGVLSLGCSLVGVMLVGVPSGVFPQ